ncbi:MAG: alpha-galactosidase [Victivallaceae bacterium]
MKRVINIGKNVPVTKSFETIEGYPIGVEADDTDFSFVGINLLREGCLTNLLPVKINAYVLDCAWQDAEHVRLELEIREMVQNVTFRRRYLIYPGMPFMAVENFIRSDVSANLYWSHRRHLGNERLPANMLESCADSLRLPHGFNPVKAVEFRGRTDYHNDLVLEHAMLCECSKINGNILFCENDCAGLFFLQEAPPSSERRDFEEYDFRIDADNTVRSCGWGIFPSELIPRKMFKGYRHVTGFYRKGEAALNLKTYLKSRFPQHPEKGFSVMVNPWGAGHFPELVNEQFLRDEIVATAKLGATHYQIDDGWQEGRVLGELSFNNRRITPELWEISGVRLPDGLKPICATADKSKVELALWVAPAYNCEYRDWRIMADIIFGLYQEYQIRIFKIDGVKIRTKEAEDNLELLVRSLRERSAGEISFNFDTTNGQRTGYFMFLEYGNIFLENRYVCHDWGLGYHPEDTLKNLWNLSKYIRPQVLQIEVPGHEDVNHDFYKRQGRIQPDCYPPEYWAMIAFFANPLLWLAPSLLSENIMSSYRKIIELHLKHRQRIFAGEIFPVGKEPDGSAVTGFVAHMPQDDSGYILLFRELGAESKAKINIPYIKHHKAIKIIYCSEQISVSMTVPGQIEAEFEYPGSCCLLQY